MPFSEGSDLVLLLLAGFRSLVAAAESELTARGYTNVRPVSGFALRAIVSGADTASELGRHLTISKQAAAKIITGLQESGYVVSETDPNDARCKRLHVTERGLAMLRESEVVFDELRAEWAKTIGDARLKDMESSLAALLGFAPLRFDTPGWMARDVGVS